MFDPILFSCNSDSKFESISESATKEYNLERAMDKMRAEWKDMEFNIVPYR